MAARNADVAVAANTWTALTDGDVSGNITISSRYHYDIFLKAAVDGTTPTTFAGAVAYNARMGEQGKTIAELFPGLSSPDRIFAYCSEATVVNVSHG